MGKIVKGVAIAALIVGAAIATGGVTLAPSLGALSGAGIVIGGTVIGGAALTSTLLLAGAAIIQGVAGQFAGKPALATGGTGLTSRVSVDPSIRQWICIGETAMPTQLIYFGTSGANNEFLSMVFAHACHPIAGFTGLNLNNIATTFPTPSGPYVGILSIETADGTQTANPFTSVNGGQWGAAQIGQGLALSHFRWTYDQAKLASGLPQNVQFIGKGIRVYDPRRDSTRGGSGAHRADNEATWQYEVSGVAIGRNPALVELSYRLGWRKAGRLWAGMGEDPANIDYASYIASANICDEIVNAKPRYRIDGLLSLGDIHNVNIGKILATCAGKPLDSGGLIGLWVGHDDTAAAAMTITDSDWVGDFGWQPLPEGEVRNTARGEFIDPASFYQSQPYKQVQPADLVALDNGEELVDTLDFALVHDPDQARRLASIRLRESRQGKLIGPTALKTLGLRPSNVVAVNHPRMGWTARRFRVETMALAIDKVQLAMRAVQSSDYADVANVAMFVPGSLPTVGFIPVLGVLAYRDFVDFAAEVTGATKPANNATAGGNLIKSPGFADGNMSGWGITGTGHTLLLVSGIDWAVAQYGTATGELTTDSYFLPAGSFMFCEISVLTGTGGDIPNGAFIWAVKQRLVDGTGEADAFAESVPYSAGANFTRRAKVGPFATDRLIRSSTTRDPSRTLGAYLITGGYSGLTENSADVTASQPIVSLLSPTSGRALDGFGASDGTPFTRIVASGNARDGDVITFPMTFSAAPAMSFLYGGASAAAGDNISIRFEGLTGSGFTFRAKSQAVTVGSTITDGSATSGGAGEPDQIINRTNGSDPFDDQFAYSFTATVGDIFPGEPGRLRVGLFAYAFGAWVQVGSASVGATGSYTYSVTPGPVAFGTGSEFGISVLSATGTGTALSSFDDVTYTTGTVTESSLTPAGASAIYWEARL